MVLTVLHGSPRKGNTFKLTEVYKKAIQSASKENIQFNEFFFPKDMDQFCIGCFICYTKSEYKCPHQALVQPILESIKNSDGLIITSPVYVYNMTASLKAFFDHTGYLFSVHRPIINMYTKPALIITTAAGGGTRSTANSIADILKFWGVSSIKKERVNVRAINYDSIDDKRKTIINKKAYSSSVRFINSLQKPPNKSSLFTTMFMMIMRKVIKNYPDDNIDKIYWQENKLL